MDANEIIAAFESLPNGGALSASCSGGRTLVTFAAFMGVGRNIVRAQSNDPSVPAAMEEAFAELQVKLAAVNP